jgi:hypothetical protein
MMIPSAFQTFFSSQSRSIASGGICEGKSFFSQRREEKRDGEEETHVLGLGKEEDAEGIERIIMHAKKR